MNKSAGVISRDSSAVKDSAQSYLDKVLAIEGSNGETVTFDYFPGGQLAAKSSGAPSSDFDFTWDGLALVERAGETFAVEPHISGGAIVASFAGPEGIPTYYVNDILSTTLAVIAPDRVEIIPLTAFGKPRNSAPANAPEPADFAIPEPVSPPETLSPEHGAPATTNSAALQADQRQKEGQR